TDGPAPQEATAGTPAAGSLPSRLVTFDPHHARDGPDDVQVVQFLDGGGQGRVRGGVGDDDQDRVGGPALLADRGDAHAVLGEHAGHGGEDAGLVGDVEADVVAGDHLAHRAGGQVGVGGLAVRPNAGEAVAAHRDDVAEDRRGG